MISHPSPAPAESGPRDLLRQVLDRGHAVLDDPAALRDVAGPELAGPDLGIGQDITARQRAEAALRRSDALFRSLIENTSDVVSILAPCGTVRYESPSVQSVLGWRPDELLGTNAFDLVHPDDLPRVRETFQRALNHPGTSDRIEFRARHKDGSWRLLEAVGNSLLHVEGAQGILINARDISERLQLEEQLRHAQRMEAVGQLAGGVAHEFSNLLSVILCYSDLMLKDLEPDHHLRLDIEQIRNAAGRASEVTSQLLTFSRRQPVRSQILDLNQVVAKMARLLGPILGERIELALALCPEPAQVKGDPGQLEQVLLNLALNSRDAMSAGGSIRIETAKLSQGGGGSVGPPPGGTVLLTFSDTGCGMDLQTRNRAFEPFFTTKEKTRGTGLGLSTVYGIIHQHGGTISIESQAGKGTTFHIQLPPSD